MQLVALYKSDQTFFDCTITDVGVRQNTAGNKDGNMLVLLQYSTGWAKLSDTTLHFCL